MKLVTYADDVALVIVTKHIGQINPFFDSAFVQIDHWMDDKENKLQLLWEGGYIVLYPT